MSYLCGGYLSGELTDEQALDSALSNATGDRQINNFKKYYRQVAALSPAARANLAANLQRVLAQLPAKSRNVVESMALRTASYVDPRQATGLGNPAAAATGVATTAQTISTITGILASLATVGLSVATTIDQRKQDKKQAEAAVKSERANQALIQQQMEAQRIANEEAKLRLQPGGAALQVAPDGSLIAPKTTSAAAVGTGVALTAAAAYLLIR